MDDLELSARDLAALRALMAMEPVPGQPLPAPAVLEKVHVLVPCDEMGIGYVDMTGLVTAGVRVAPARHRNTVVIDLDLHEQHGGPFYLGVMHWRLHPAQAESCGNFLGPTRGRVGHRFPQRHRPRRPVRLPAGRQALHRPGARDPGPARPRRCSGWPANAPRPGCRPR